MSQWVRMKCKFGCGEYGRGGACPPETPSVAECRDFFNEYEDAVILHFEGLMDKPEDRHTWSAGINAKLVQLERAVFTSGFERTFLLFMDSCCFCKDCTPAVERPVRILAWLVRPLRPWLWMYTLQYVKLDSQSTCSQTMTKKWIGSHF